MIRCRCGRDISSRDAALVLRLVCNRGWMESDDISDALNNHDCCTESILAWGEKVDLFERCVSYSRGERHVLWRALE